MLRRLVQSRLLGQPTPQVEVFSFAFPNLEDTNHTATKMAQNATAGAQTGRYKLPGIEINPDDYKDPFEQMVYSAAAKVLDQHMRTVNLLGIVRLDAANQRSFQAVQKIVEQAESEIGERDQKIEERDKKIEERDQEIESRDQEIKKLRAEVAGHVQEAIKLRYEIAHMAGETGRMNIMIRELSDPDYEEGDEDLEELEKNLKLLDEQFEECMKEKKEEAEKAAAKSESKSKSKSESKGKRQGKGKA